MRSSPLHFQDAFRVFLRIGLLSFGGPAAQIALMHREIVDEKGWLTERQFLNALSFCMLLPGPEAMQLATYSGWRLHGVRGGLMAGLLFVVPGAVVIWALALTYFLWGTTSVMASLFLGVKAAVLVVVLQALLKLAKKALIRPWHWGLAGLAFVAIFVFNVPFPFIVLGAGICGAIVMQSAPVEVVEFKKPPVMDTMRTILLWLVIWMAPIALIWLLGGAQVFVDIGLFFSKLATVTFGGAYAVLAYMAQDAVQGQGWLSASEMLDGLGLAETTPGPLILVTEFVGFFAGARAGEHALLYGSLAAILTVWVTFVPCFLWVFTGAPYIEYLGQRPRIMGALQAISAAIVGVILNLSLWFSLHVMFDEVTQVQSGVLTLWLPEIGSLNWTVLAISVWAGIALLWQGWDMVRVLCVAAILGYASVYFGIG
ncbi:MAG: chromate efflux transporter [Halocynthiibacter sp.]